MVEDLIFRMERANVMKQERVRMLSEENERPWEAWKAENGGTGFQVGI